MRQAGLHLLAAVIAALCCIPPVTAQAPVSLQEQLNAQYKLARMGSDSNGFTVVDAGHAAGDAKGRSAERAVAGVGVVPGEVPGQQPASLGWILRGNGEAGFQVLPGRR